MSKQVEEPVSSILRPVLDTFLNDPVAITGCHSYGLALPCCEYDVLLVTKEEKSGSTMRVGERYFDIISLTDKEAMSPANPELAVSISFLKAVRDSSWVLSTSASTAKAMLDENTRRSAESRLSLALKGLGRVEEALSSASLVDADYWLTSAGYDFAFASLFATRIPPSPTHILRQMRDISTRGDARFTEWSNSIGLEHASKKGCEKRYDGLAIIYDVIRTNMQGQRRNDLAERYRSEAAIEVLQKKTAYLTGHLQSVDCYAFLGYEATRTLNTLLELESTRHSAEPQYVSAVSSLTNGNLRIISEEVIRSLGWNRTEKTIRRMVDPLRDAISLLAKKI